MHVQRDAVPPAAADAASSHRTDLGAGLRAAAAAAAHEVCSAAHEAAAARRIASAAIQRFFTDAAARLCSFFSATPAPARAAQRVELLLIPDDAAEHTHVALCVVSDDEDAPKGTADGGAPAGGDAGAEAFSPLPQLFEAALVLAAAALAVLVLRGRGVPLRAVSTAMRRAAAAL
jgi:hypothetical protein